MPNLRKGENSLAETFTLFGGDYSPAIPMESVEHGEPTSEQGVASCYWLGNPIIPVGMAPMPSHENQECIKVVRLL